jgi:tetratricopeptide (TPR) repeat protein
MPRVVALLVSFHLGATCAFAGLHYSGETYAELPSQWRGFLIDQRTLRNVAVAAKPGGEANPARVRYEAEAARLEKQQALTADERADLGAIYVRLGRANDAVALLRQAQREHPNHFAIAANLGTAWQLAGNLEQAALALEDAVRLAPGKWLAAEEHHLKLVRQRLRAKPAGELDDLFGVRFVDDAGMFTPGKLSAAARKQLPTRAIGVVQQLALWLPADGPLLWQLAELANAHGDLRNAAAMYDGCVIQFNMGSPELRRRRQLVRAAADALPKVLAGDKSQHEDKHAGTIAFRSKRPLVSRIDAAELPPVSDTGINDVPWQVFGDTTVDQQYRPTFSKHLQQLDGKTVALNGFMQPLREADELTGFLLLEYPVGCWYCEMPETTGIIYVELPRGQTATYKRGLTRVVGRLTLNASDPEDFLYAIREARVGGVD